MIEWSQLAIPILLSTVFIFIASSVIHMVLKWHNPEYRALPNEDEVRAVLGKPTITPGQYIFPHCKDSKAMESPEMQAKFEQGPLGVMWIKKPGKIQLGPFLMKWVLYTLVVSALCGYVASFVLVRGMDAMHVFRTVVMVAWLAYSWQGPSDSIWKGKPWSSTFREMVDGLVYAGITAGTFLWFWPK
jgi:hypothetical protein